MSDVGNRIEMERQLIATLATSEVAFALLPSSFSAKNFETLDYKGLFDKIHEIFVDEGKVNPVRLCRRFPELTSLVRDILKGPVDLDGQVAFVAERLIDHRPIEQHELDALKFKPMLSQELTKVLGLTIKQDQTNKLITFLCMLSAYTENSQMNVSFNAPSSTGKSFIPTELAKLLPSHDVITVGYCSPTAFFHSYGEFDKELGGYRVDLSRKVLVFLDQPHQQLLQHLRPLLSHDQKEILVKITDKSQKHGLRTKNILLIGFPAVVFCTAGLKVDEQETTRFLMLSPETTQEKIRQGIEQKIKRESDSGKFRAWLEADLDRQLLKARIDAIKRAGVTEINVGNEEMLKRAFFERHRIFKPRHQRDIGRLIGLVKTFALLNLWFREREGGAIVANEQDIKEALVVWDSISKSQELNLPPYIYQLYTDVFLNLYSEKAGASKLIELPQGLSRKEIIMKHAEVYGRPLADWFLRQEILPMLESSGLVVQEPDPSDKRKMLIYPTT